MDQNAAEKINNVMSKMDIPGLTDKMKKMATNMPDILQLKSMLDEQTKLSKPASQKNTDFNGFGATIGLTSDCRVIITFSSHEDAKTFYDKTNDLNGKKTNTWHKVIKKIFGK
jgi:hypothetical protein